MVVGEALERGYFLVGEASETGGMNTFIDELSSDGSFQWSGVRVYRWRRWLIGTAETCMVLWMVC